MKEREQEMRYNVFFSYSQRDSAIARNLVQRLETAGLRCFISEKDIRAGDVWEETIREAIRDSSLMLLLVTPRSKNSLWVAAEAGAAWALKKPLIAALMFVEPHELIDPIRRHQSRLVESQEQVDAFVSELTTVNPVTTQGLSGQWAHPEDNDTVYFRQVGSQVVGYYDYGSKSRKVGEYVGRLVNGMFEYSWRWLEQDLRGSGRMKLSKDGQELDGWWWYENDRNAREPVKYRRVSSAMPSWLQDQDFLPHTGFLNGG